MARTARAAPGGLIYHVLNRVAGRMRMFSKDADFEAFQQVMLEASERCPIRILSYCLLRNHWHFVVWPETDGQVTEFFRWLAQTHAVRWRVSRRTVGHGPLYQGRFKSFPVQDDEHLLTLLRYVEGNPLAAGLVESAELWPWSSLGARTRGDKALKAVLSPWPVKRPRNWIARVNQPLIARELKRLHVSIQRNQPFGSDDWVQRTASELHLEHTIRPEGRPRKAREPEPPANH